MHFEYLLHFNINAYKTQTPQYIALSHYLSWKGKLSYQNFLPQSSIIYPVMVLGVKMASEKGKKIQGKE